MRSRSIPALATLAALTGCPFPWFSNDDGPGGPPCEDDVLGCESNSDKFEIDPTCTLDGELELVLGQGETEFEPLGPGMVPTINYGVQGGQHIWTALQVHNPALDYPLLKIDITVSTCYASNCSSPSSWTVDNTRELVTDQTTMTVTDEGWFEQLRMLVLVSTYGSGTTGRVELLVTDACARQGYVVVEGPTA